MITTGFKRSKTTILKQIYQDGLYEIRMGLFCLFMSSIFFLDTLEGNTIVLKFLFLSMGSLTIGFFEWYLKTRIIYKRVGILEAKMHLNIGYMFLMLLTSFCLTGIILLFLGGFTYPIEWLYFMPLIFSSFFMGQMLGKARRSRLTKFYVYIGILCAISLIGSIYIKIQEDWVLFDQISAITFSIFGCLILLQGIRILISFMKNTKVLIEDESNNNTQDQHQIEDYGENDNNINDIIDKKKEQRDDLK